MIQRVSDAGTQARVRYDQLISAVSLGQNRDQGLLEITDHRLISRDDHADERHMVHFQDRGGCSKRVFRLLAALNAVPDSSLVQKNRCFGLLIHIFLPGSLLLLLVICAQGKPSGGVFAPLGQSDF